ncbi:D-glucuronyl C5-epimerase family protein [Streptomyces sp. NPDC002659]|uniref:D-glucuronyl C5-epimerase family protein n=1 Tax=Streptomyces sp. NPDC002659 TaxID=3364656 RepID=UPI00369955D0
MAENGPIDIGRRKFIQLTGAAAAGTAIAGCSDFTAFALESRAALLTGKPGSPTMPVPPLPDPIREGRASAPATRVRIPYANGPVNPSVVEDDIPTTLPFEFKTSGYTCALDLPDVMQPWRDRSAERIDAAPHDADGVRMFEVDGKLYDHPVGQIQFGLQNITSYRQTSDLFFLNRAKAQAQRLIDRRVETRGAWYFPYPFDWAQAVHTGIAYTAPWYSGMAQGEALSLFSQLAQLGAVSEAERTLYKTAADGAFASLLRADDAKPWVIAKDSAGYLWIHEYPIDAPGTSDYTFNGFMFAALGLWDYYQLTRNPLAEQLFDGSLTTFNAYFPAMRNKGWLSHYCLTHQIPSSSYHPVHINLLRQIQWLSSSARHAYLSDVLMDDYPYPTLGANGGTIAFTAGSYTFYKFDGTGAVTSSTAVSFARDTQAPASQRVRIQGRGVHYLIKEGAYAGWYVPEYFPKVYLLGEWFRSVYRPQRTATFPANVSITCHKVDANGTITATKTVEFASDSNAPFDRRSIVNGRPMVQITAGSLTGFWAPSSHVLTDGR